MLRSVSPSCRRKRSSAREGGLTRGFSASRGSWNKTITTGEGSMSYMLYVNDKPKTVGYSLEETQGASKPYLADRAALRIESLVMPEQSQAWVYDGEIQTWVAQ